MERVKGIEPSLSGWEPGVLPLNYTRSVPGRKDALTPRGDSTSSPPGAIDRPVLRQITRWKSARFRVRAFLPYPLHYREAFAFSIILYPLQHQITLRLSLSAEQARRRIGLTVFRIGNRVGKVPPFRR